jgi:hypothetical protein
MILRCHRTSRFFLRSALLVNSSSGTDIYGSRRLPVENAMFYNARERKTEEGEETCNGGEHCEANS